MAQEFVVEAGGRKKWGKKIMDFFIHDLHGSNTEPAAISLELSLHHSPEQEQTLLLQREHRKLEDKDRMKNTNSWREKVHRETGKQIFLLPVKRKEKGWWQRMKSIGKQRGSTPDCLVLTWEYLRIICPISRQKLNILTYISETASGINRNIPHNRHQQQTQLNLDWEQFLRSSEGSHASVFQRPTQAWDALFLEMAWNVFRNICCTSLVSM